MKKLKVCWISAGVSSFVAGYLLKDSIDIFIYIDVADQHEDSMRFIKDCEKELGKTIQIMRSSEYRTVEDCVLIFGTFKHILGFAPCTNWLKKRVRKEWESKHKDYEITYVWGFDLDERKRAERTVESNPEFGHEFPLIDKRLTKSEVHGFFESHFDFERPKMYELGYPNNNCIGCVKGGMGYWNKIRVDFPEVFKARAELERKVNHSILKESDGTPIYLDELDPKRGNMSTEIFPDCGIMCYLAQAEINGKPW